MLDVASDPGQEKNVCCCSSSASRFNVQDLCSVASGSETLAADPLSPVSCEFGPPRIGLVCPEHPADAQSDRDVRNSEGIQKSVV